MPRKGDKKSLPKTGASTSSKLELNEEKDSSINESLNLAEYECQHNLTITGEHRSIPEWMKDGASVKDKDILCENVRITTPDGRTELIKDARVQFVYGRRYGLIGPNGKGKTSLLRHVADYLLDGVPKHLRIIHVAQHADIASKQPVLQHVVNSDEQKNYLEKEQERLYDLLENSDDSADLDADAINEQLERIEERLELIDARRAESRADAILSGLGFSEERKKGLICDLSGGWRQRVALACALFVSPDVLLLDEPTNHLDFPAVTWLTSYLKNIEHTLVCVSHDRNFLNNIITDVIDLTEQRLDYYKGDYNNYVKRREEAFVTRKRAYETQQKKIDELKQFIEESKKSDNAGTANQIASRKLILEKLLAEAVPEPVEIKEFRFQFPVPGKLDHQLLEINGMSFSWSPNDDDPENSPMLLKDVNLNMDMESRVGVLGVNGAGKTTLIKLIRGKLQPTLGVCRLNDHARHVLFTQHHMDQLDLTKNPMDFLQAKFPAAKEHQIRGVMGRFGFDATKITQKISTLSGGEKSRVAFATLTWQEPHLIMMDEPTNHLDLETIEALIYALNKFEGGVLLVSHDQYFLSKVCKEFWAVNQDGEVKVFYDLEEAKLWTYPESLDFTIIKKGSLPIAVGPDGNAPKAAPRSSAGAAAGGKKKRKTKKGAGGISMAELKVSQALEEAEQEKKREELRARLAAEAEEERKQFEAKLAQERLEKELEMKEERTRRRLAALAAANDDGDEDGDDDDEQVSGAESEVHDDNVEALTDEVKQLDLDSKKHKKKDKSKSKEESEEEEEEEESARKLKKKDKKDKKKRVDSDADEVEEESAKKHKKEKKKSRDDASSDDEDSPKRAKKSKKARDQSDAEDEDAPKKSKKDKKKRKDEVDDEEGEEDAPKKSKKEKKKRRDEEDEEPEEEQKEKKKKKEKKRQEASDEEEADTRKKDKKDKKKRVDSDADEVEEESAKKHKKEKKKSRDSD